MRTVHLHVRRGQIDDAGSWLYVWTLAGQGAVVYVGGTSLAPALRTWLHLHHPDPAIARVAHRFPDALTESFDVVGCAIPDDVDRREAKAELVNQLARHGLLADDYVGDPPDGASRSDRVRACVAAVVTHLQESLAH